MVILLVIVVILINNLHRSRLGRAWMAIREDEVAAAAIGINTVIYYAPTLLQGAGLGNSASLLASSLGSPTKTTRPLARR